MLKRFLCSHNWLVTAIYAIDGGANHNYPESTRIYRVCKRCKKQENHQVVGNLSDTVCKELFEGN